MYEEPTPMEQNLETIYNSALDLKCQQNKVDKVKKELEDFDSDFKEFATGQKELPIDVTLESLEFKRQVLQNTLRWERGEEDRLRLSFIILCTRLPR